MKFTGAQDVQCLQGMLYSPVKFTGAPDAQCLEGMPNSPVKFTGAPDAQCLQGMPYSLVKFTGASDAHFLQGSGCHHPQTNPQGGMLCTRYTQILIVAYHICSEMYHEVLILLQTVSIMVCCVLHGWSEPHNAKGCAHCGNQFTPILGVIVTPYFNSDQQSVLMFTRKGMSFTHSRFIFLGTSILYVYVHRCWWPVEELCSCLGMWGCVKLTGTAPVVAQQNETREAATCEGTLCIGTVLMTIIHCHHTLINVCRECGATHLKTNATSDTQSMTR